MTAFAAQAVERLQTAWGDPASRRRSSLGPFQPIAGSDFDHAALPGVENPYWDVVRWMPAEARWFGTGLEPCFPHMPFEVDTANALSAAGIDRTPLCTRYAWSIISPGDLTWMRDQLDGRAVVEIGAGSGYWAWQLEQAGVDVAAYDPNPVGESNTFATYGPYTTVLRDDASAVRHHQDRALLMVWPPYGGAHARHALSVHEGDLLLYAGEGAGGCTADDDFYELLDEEWDEVSVASSHVTWWGIHCRLAAYRRKERAS